MDIFLVLHSWIRWAVVILFVYNLITSFQGFFAKKEYTEKDRKMGLFLLIFTHLQFVIGIILYLFNSDVKIFFADAAVGMKNKLLRFWAIEHPVMMIVAVTLFTIGYSLAKRSDDSTRKFRLQMIFWTIALLVILLSIPWQFSPMVARPLFRLGV